MWDEYCIISTSQQHKTHVDAQTRLEILKKCLQYLVLLIELKPQTGLGDLRTLRSFETMTKNAINRTQDELNNSRTTKILQDEVGGNVDDVMQ